MSNRALVCASILTPFLLLAATAAAQPVPERLHGSWRIDAGASFEHRAGLAKLDGIGDEQLRSLFERRAESPPIEFSADAFSLGASPEARFACRTRYADAAVVYLSCHRDDHYFTLAVVVVGEGIRLLSSDTDDTDVFVWSRTAAPATD